jgi:spermidine synthase
MVYGLTIHGIQSTDPVLSSKPSGYYIETSGIGLAFKYHPKRIAGQSMRVGAIGLGTGSIAVYGLRGDRITFFEINPEITRLAKKWFTYILESYADITIREGDARSLIETGLKNGSESDCDLLILDAFSGDTIPSHLLTKEAFELYLRYIDKTDGIIAIHITNNYFDFSPLMKTMADYFGLQSIVISASSTDALSLSSIWVLMTYNREFMNMSEIQKTGSFSRVFHRQVPLWTDDKNSLLWFSF